MAAVSGELCWWADMLAKQRKHLKAGCFVEPRATTLRKPCKGFMKPGAIRSQEEGPVRGKGEGAEGRF